MMRGEDKVRCSFCGKTQNQVRKLIAGPDGVYICDDCVDVCGEIIDEEFDDEEDIIFYEVVMEKRKTAEAWLVTGNIRHFPKEPFIVTPREMLDIIEGNGK